MQEARSKFGIGTEEGFEILQQLIYAAQPQIVVSKGDFLARLARSRAGYQPLPPSSRKPLGTGDATQSYRTRVPYAAPRGETERKVARIWEEVLRIPQVGVNDDFVELGGHSLFAIQIAARIREEFQIDIEMRQMLELPTIAEVAELIEKIRSESHDLEAMKLLDEITGLSPEEVKARILVMQNPPPD
jgi:acyl carrier protein